MASGLPGFPSVGLNAGGAFKRAWDEYNRLRGAQGIGLGQIAGAEASDPAAAQAQAGFADTGGQYGGGAGVAGATGLFGALPSYAGQGTIASQGARDQATTAGISGQLDVATNAANAIAQQEQANLALQQAQTGQAAQGLSLFGGLTDLLTNPKGLGGNIMSIGQAPGSPSTSPAQGIFGKLKELLDKIPGIPGFPTPSQTILPPGPLSNPSSPWDILGGQPGQNADLIAALLGEY